MGTRGTKIIFEDLHLLTNISQNLTRHNLIFVPDCNVRRKQNLAVPFSRTIPVDACHVDPVDCIVAGVSWMCKASNQFLSRRSCCRASPAMNPSESSGRWLKVNVETARFLKYEAGLREKDQSSGRLVYKATLTILTSVGMLP